ncbi:MAG: (Fe-S)-binding protein [Bryobacteraceae bacterium]|nr:(Fe-S)-binding protein [Bryobacteraceae bacterium]
MTGPSTVEIALFAALLLASFFLFWRRFGRVVAIIRASRPDAGFAASPWAPRIARFIAEVLLQSKVIRHRPLPGLAHAFVFWGFLAFALVTLNHLAHGFGFAFFDTKSGFFGPFYANFAYFFALLVAVSITGLALRRFIARPRWLGEQLSWESGLIALLILALMVTYVLEYQWGESRVLWWAHTLALLVFLPLVPHTKHLHLILSPLTILLKQKDFAHLPPLRDDDDFGLDTGRDISQRLALQAFSCVECGRCQQHCPAHNTGKLLNPKEIAIGLRSYLNEHGAAAEPPLLGVHLAEEAVFQCTTCGACEYQCPVGIEHLPILLGLRRGAVNTGKWEDEHGGELFLKLERNGNPLGLSAYERDKFVKKAEFPIFDGSQDYCLWLGCMGSFDPRGREIVQALAAVLRHLNVTFGVLKKEKCTGDSARRLGNDLAFQQLAEFNIEQMRAAGVKKLISICPHCVRTISHDWREFGVEFAIEHHSVFLERHNHRLPPSEVTRETVAYHDPCYLGRYQRTYDEPRSVAASVHDLIDPPRSRDTSFCCGAGGGLVFLGEEKGKRVSHERAEELLETGAPVVAAACPFCHTMFRDAFTAIKPEGAPQLVDIAELAAARLPAEDEFQPPVVS